MSGSAPITMVSPSIATDQAESVAPPRRRRPSAWPPGRTWRRRRSCGRRRPSPFGAGVVVFVGPTTTVPPSIATDLPNSSPDAASAAVSLATWPYVAPPSLVRKT